MDSKYGLVLILTSLIVVIEGIDCLHENHYDVEVKPLAYEELILAGSHSSSLLGNSKEKVIPNSVAGEFLNGQNYSPWISIANGDSFWKNTLSPACNKSVTILTDGLYTWAFPCKVMHNMHIMISVSYQYILNN